MLAWLVAATFGVTLAGALYMLREGASLAQLAPLVALRACALTLIGALIIGAPAGRARPPAPLVALDASASWLRGGDSAGWSAAREQARRAAGDSLLYFGDSVWTGSPPREPREGSSRLQPLVERALGAGRPVTVFTDGEIDDPGAARNLPPGSLLEVRAHPQRVDLAVVSIEAPRATVSGDTIELRATLRSGSAPVPGATLTILAAGRPIVSARLDSMPAYATRTEVLRAAVTAATGPTVLAAAVAASGDVEPRNDTVGVALDVSRAAGAVLVSSSPDYDARFLVPVLRGAVALPTRAFFRVAPRAWRAEGSLAPVPEADVRAAVREAPLVILHGDTALFGPPRTVTTGALALIVPPADVGEELYPVSAPASPIATVLAGIAWDSLPPIAMTAPPSGDGWQGLVAARARRFERRPVIVGSESGRRVVVIGASGFWRWRFRGGSAADAYAALWGSVFDWLTAERADVRAALPAEGIVRTGQPIRWRRGIRGDTTVTVQLRRRTGRPVVTAASPGEAEPLPGVLPDTFTLGFGRGVTTVESAPLPPGAYDVRVPGGAAILVVNTSRELLPRPTSVSAGTVPGRARAADSPRLRDRSWAFVLLLAAVCAEWLLRRRMGLR